MGKSEMLTPPRTGITMTLMDATIIFFILVGFLTQMVDGSLGMGYGTLSVSFLLSLGVPPVAASSSVHAAKAFTGWVSGVSHWRLGNVDQVLFGKLLVSGVGGGVAGAIMLTLFSDGILRPLIATYLILMGINILRKSFRTRVIVKNNQVYLVPLGAAGGFVDAVGGGGWGPIVTSTLLANGHNPPKSIGSGNFAEAFVATAISVTFLANRVSAPQMDWGIIAGLIIGGAIAAPLAAYVCGKLPAKFLMIAVGLLVIALNIGLLLSIVF